MSFQAVVVPSNTVFPVQAENSILDGALNSSINLPHSCKGGTCGSCKCKVIIGKYAYIDNKPPSILTAEEIDAGYILTCMTRAQSDITLDIPKLSNWPIKNLPGKIIFLEKSDNLAIIKIMLPANQEFKFDAGQYIDLTANGITRSYSIANFDNSNTLELHIRYRINGKFSEIVWNQFKIGQLLKIKGPLGNFTLEKSNAPMLLVCTGTGFAPIKSILEQMIQQNNLRKTILLWGNYCVDDFYHLAFLEDIKTRLNIDIALCLSNEKIDKFYYGMVTDYIKEHCMDLSEYEVYACGNPNMISDVSELTIKLGLTKENFYSDSFTHAIEQ
jgi:CDP-4-dehydro-6-deoxyglucose reductase, E3